jgi:ABC-type phosphate transport system substrate-binding protein
MKNLFLATVLALMSVTGAMAQEFVVVVNDAADASLNRSDVADIFLKRKGGWKPVDQEKNAPVRAGFSKDILGRDVSAVEAHWQQQIFAGRDVPPPTKGSDAEVLAHVRSNPKGIGYVTPGTPLGDGVKALSLE